MAFFKFRLPSRAAGEHTGSFSNAPTESVEVLRRRARHRLIGASVLVVLGVVGFPLVFDTQPRPVSVDIAVDIPDRANSKPLVLAASSTKPLPTGAALDPKEEVVAPAKSAPKPEPKVEAKLEPKAEPKADIKPKADAVKADAKPADDKPAASDNKDTAPRFIVQVGAFSEDAKALEVRNKLEKSGFKTYTHVANTKEGPRTRVRVGPFASRDEADKVAQKIKQLQLQPAVLAL
jgi:DedD protein